MFLVILSPQLRWGEDGYSWLEMAVFPLPSGGLDLIGIGYFPYQGQLGCSNTLAGYTLITWLLLRADLLKRSKVLW